ncbi:hypothetical protein Leryth_021900 [Lithospermum erythrorhizon]|nr:hypothetical protein Leryth_021900 [Lithospermum erythrorhizon]
MAQLYKEHAHTDDYVLDSVYSPRTPTNSPFVRSRIISRTEGDFLAFPVKIVEKQTAKNFTYSKEKPICGIPHLPRIGDLNLLKRSPRQTECSSNQSTTTNGKHQNLKGQPHGVLLFCLGISAGILSSFLANQREVDKLNQLLKQKNNLVEDLQDELEMKDSLTVKELAVEDDESQDTHHDSLYNGCSHSPEAKLNIQMESDQGKYHDDETEVKSLSKIEAELEAELERLELSMITRSLEGKLSNLVELEPDFLPDVAVGELKADLFSRQTGDQAYPDQDEGDDSITHPADYAVSPTELSLRLHEVIESRLEARVKELEAALQNSQRRFQFAKYDRIESWRKFPSSDDISSSDPASPVHENEPPCASHPVVINLPDEAQETNEANDLFSMLNDSEDDKTHVITNSSHGTSSRPCELSPCQAPKEGWVEGNIDPCVDEEAYNTMSFDLSSSTESDGDSEDEIEKLLIQHIVERARKQGSSVILDAQKALFSGNEY